MGPKATRHSSAGAVCVAAQAKAHVEKVALSADIVTLLMILLNGMVSGPSADARITIFIIMVIGAT